MDLGLKGRAAIVGGGSSGLGLASAKRLAEAGCRVALWSRGGEGLEKAAAEIRSSYRAEVVTIAGDAAVPETARRVADEALRTLGEVDIAVLNQGGPPSADPLATDPNEWRRSFQLLAVTQIELATLLLPGMRAGRWGRIVSILSSGIREPIPTLPYSNACRGALQAWLKTIAPLVAADGITVNGVLPGRLDTPRVRSLDQARAEQTGRTVDEAKADLIRTIPASRYGDPDELGAYVAWLCSDRASYQTGTFVPIDGGMLKALP